MRSAALTPEEVAEIKRLYHQQNGAYGVVARLMRQFNVSRPTILKALDSYDTQTVKQLEQTPRSGTPDEASAVLTGPEGFIDSSNEFSCDTCQADKTLWIGQDRHTAWCPERNAA